MINRYLFLIALIIPAISARSQESVKNAAINDLRNFRTEVQDSDDIGLRDSILYKTNKLINWARTLDDTVQQRQLYNYISFAERNLKRSTGEQKNDVIRSINQDLELKMSADGPISELPLENSRELFKSYPMTFRILVNGKKPGHSYTVYWARFLGRDQRLLIRSKSFNGSFLTESDRFNVQLSLPGYYTFWIQDTGSTQVLRSDPDHFVFVKGAASSPINFITY